MIENTNEKQARQEILRQVAIYYHQFHKIKSEYKTGDWLPYASRVYNEHEMINLVDSALDFWLTSGRYTETFEYDFCQYIGIQYCSLVNSGSSANLLAFMALTSPLIEKERRIFRGDEIITLAAGFPTTVAPIIQFGAIPIFVDVTIPQYNINTSLLNKAISHKTKAVFIAHTMGNPFNITDVKAFCDLNNLWLIEDNCDALGSQYEVNGIMKYTGTFGDIGTSSFYPPHHMTMGEGGAVYTSNALLHKIIRSLRDRGRDCVCPSGKDNMCGNRFNRQYGELPSGYDHKYIYSHFGYNMKATDMQAAIGVAQLKKMPIFVRRRQENFKKLHYALSSCTNKLILPEPCPDSLPSWFGFLMTCRDGVNRNEVVKMIEANGIQTRSLFAGNIIKHPCFDEMRTTSKEYRIIGDLNETDRIMNNSFWVGIYPGMTDKAINYIAENIRNIINK